MKKPENFLEDVLSKKIAVPYRRYHNEVAHRSNIRDGFCSGRYPNKATSEFLKLLDNLESNAEYKGMDLDRLKIIFHCCSQSNKIKKIHSKSNGKGKSKI